MFTVSEKLKRQILDEESEEDTINLLSNKNHLELVFNNNFSEQIQSKLERELEETNPKWYITVGEVS